MKRSRNIAARMGHWSATHRKKAIWGWLGFVVLAFVLGANVVGMKTLKPEDTGVGESGRVSRILGDDFETPAKERVMIQSPTRKASSPEFKAVVTDVVARMDREKDVASIESPLSPLNQNLISVDGRTALVDLEIVGDPDDAVDKIGGISDAVTAAQDAHPGFAIESFGVSAEDQVNRAFADDLEKAGLLSIPITLIILIVAFGSLVAAGIPLLLALTAVLGTMGLLAFVSLALPFDQAIGALVLLIGLAVGVDYSMFYLKREREERAKGRGEQASLEAAAATSGRSVLISGLTVMIAMFGMFLTGDPTFSGFGIATMLVVAVAVLGSLTVLPALLSWLGDRVDKLHVPVVRSLRPRDGEGRFWSAILDPVLRHPIPAIILAAAPLVALGLVSTTMKLAQPGPETYPESLPAVKTYKKLQAAFPGGEIPAEVVIRADDVTTPQMEEAIGQLKWRALVYAGMREPITTDINDRHTVAVVSIPVPGGATDDAAKDAVTSLRDEVLPGTIGTLGDGVEYGVTGWTASSMDFNDLMRSKAPLVFGFVLAFAFILLLLTFRSIVIPIKAIVLNLLSVAAAYGVLVLVFQGGVGKDLLGFTYEEGIVAFLPIFLFVILFGLSMDYHVFILSRVREGYDSGMKTEDAVAHGIKVTAGVVTSAAIVMVFVFSIFGTLSILFLKEFGVGLAAAILIDATIVRAVLLPATMKLLGDWNWYLPSWLEWLPRIGYEKEAPEAPAATPVA
ncbi:MAG TPA: MMPL family transporter [Gaiellaceae bacterium]|nr:MMPL family transporter [Gaiellaceae bacterium]HET8651543.1 MMPL family transporter [Gaiellaceae bacterium]